MQCEKVEKMSEKKSRKYLEVIGKSSYLCNRFERGTRSISKQKSSLKSFLKNFSKRFGKLEKRFYLCTTFRYENRMEGFKEKIERSDRKKRNVLNRNR